MATLDTLDFIADEKMYSRVITGEQAHKACKLVMERGFMPVSELKRKLRIDGMTPVNIVGLSLAKWTDNMTTFYVDKVNRTWTMFHDPDIESLVMKAVRQANAIHGKYKTSIYEVHEQLKRLSYANPNLHIWKVYDKLGGLQGKGFAFSYLWVTKVLQALRMVGRVQTNLYSKYDLTPEDFDENAEAVAWWVA